MNQGDFHDPYRANNWSKPGVGAAVAVGVGAAGVIATAMYFFGGREVFSNEGAYES
jgi:hypothetical protein